MILRLQSEEELELQQSRIKSQAKAVRVHVNEAKGTFVASSEHAGFMIQKATSPVKAPWDKVVTSSECKAQNGYAKQTEKTPKSRQDHPRARKPENWGQRLQGQCKALKLPIPVLEHHFHPDRRWRFDLAWIDLKVAVEIEGGLWINGRHNRAAGFLADMTKYNEAVRLGWKVFRFSPSQVKKGSALHYLMKVLTLPQSPSDHL